MENNPEAVVAVNIVAWNSMNYLPALFASLDDQDMPLRVTVVDNASTDGCGQWLSGEYPFVGVLRNMRNHGFARAHNQAILLALSWWKETDLNKRYILVCNPDVELATDCLRHMYEYLESHPETQACNPKLLRAHLRYNDSDQKETVKTKVIDATGLFLSRSLRPYDRGAEEEDRGQYDEKTDIFGCTGACALYRASAVLAASEDQQFFDEDFFAYQEDVDVAWRMRHLGMRAALVPQAVAWHHRGAPSSEKNDWLSAWIRRRNKPAFINYLSTRNHTWVLTKNLTGSEFWHCWLWLAPYELAKLAAALVSWASLKGYWSSLLGLPKMLKKRKKRLAVMHTAYKNQSPWFT